MNLKRLFSAQGTIGRRDYALLITVQLLILLALKWGGMYLTATYGAMFEGVLTGLYLAYFLLPIMLTVRRCRDAGLNPAFSVILLCPFLNVALIVFLMFKPSCCQTGQPQGEKTCSHRS